MKAIDHSVKSLSDDMIETMDYAGGIGLAANQVGYARRIFVMDTSTDRNSPKFFINPVIDVNFISVTSKSQLFLELFLPLLINNFLF